MGIFYKKHASFVIREMMIMLFCSPANKNITNLRILYPYIDILEREIKLSKGYLRSLLHYLSSVYDLGGKIKKLKDSRTNSKITISAIDFTLLIGFMLKIRSFNQLDDWLEHNDFRRIVPPKMRLPRIDAIRDSLKVIEIKGIEALHHSIIGTSIQNKLVRNGTIDEYKIVAFDGVELFESKIR